MTTETDTHIQTADSVPKTDFKVWKTIRLGTGLNTEEDFEAALKGGGFIICVDRVLGGRMVSPSEIEVDLVLCTIADLGFTTTTTLRKDVISRGEDLGLEKCVAEVGPQLRLQYADQPPGERLIIAMNDYSDYHEQRGVFVVCCTDKGKLALAGNHGSAIGSRVLLDCQMVFVKPRN